MQRKRKPKKSGDGFQGEGNRGRMNLKKKDRRNSVKRMPPSSFHRRLRVPEALMVNPTIPDRNDMTEIGSTPT